ncbi:hypothetical protein G9A89_017827 [Geosiphon pyriformis]|nr:hypothetical protein G9A89_017827 [Geosiphon pyriformis]
MSNKKSVYPIRSNASTTLAKEDFPYWRNAQTLDESFAKYTQCLESKGLLQKHEPPKTSASPLHPVTDNNNKDNSVASNVGKEISPVSNAGGEDPEASRTPEEPHSLSSKDTSGIEVTEFVLRTPRRKRACGSSRSRPRPHKSSYTTHYKPFIPDSFLKTNYLPFNQNSYSFDSLQYPLEIGIRREILYSARASLLPCPKGDTLPARRGHLLLNCPIEGASSYLDTIVKCVASKLHADLLIFDRQDLMELTADMFSRKGNATPWPLFPDLKGFNPYISASPYSTTSSVSNEEEIEDDIFVDDEEGFESSTSRNTGYENKTFGETFQFNSNSTGVLRGEMKQIIEKMDKFFEALISATSISALAASEAAEAILTPRIVYFRDVGDLIPTNFGTALINSLVDAVQNQRSMGDRIMIIAGHSPSLFAMEKKSQPSNSLVPHEVQWVNLDIFPNPALLVPFTHIAIPPSPLKVFSDKLINLITEDKRLTIRKMNARNIRAVSVSKGVLFKENDIEELAQLLDKLENIGNDVWGFEQVHRLVLNAIGIALDHENVMETNGVLALDIEHLVTASETLKSNQNMRKEFVENASSNCNSASKGVEKIVTVVGLGEEKISLPGRKNLNKEDLDRHERRILSCVVESDNIRVGFSDIHVAKSTVQTLQTLITLPLLRPKSFSYGVLSKHFISGVLLFGPPGTGKTMLAKAVAKESGSTVLEIKASDIYDMFVGEGEKNVRAIFTLARKLSPCVLFLDEVDAIFNSRRSDHHNGSHREIINQFMAEWDGLTSQNQGVLIMGATNRPFDLDDAILRRMPRRILVDLPTEKDREQILNLHLREEKLGPSLSISTIAKKTNLYSGSDLKNLCISAALAAVREDAELEEPNVKKPISKNEKPDSTEEIKIRVLEPHHFQLALKQVTPSCSEDMSSLTELRKWDAQYGDGSWKKKRLVKGIGFDGELGQINPTDTGLGRQKSLGLKALLASEITVTHRDRLCSFALDLHIHSAKLVVFFYDEHELSQDILAINTVLICSMQRQRATRQRREPSKQAPANITEAIDSARRDIQRQVTLSAQDYFAKKRTALFMQSLLAFTHSSLRKKRGSGDHAYDEGFCASAECKTI